MRKPLIALAGAALAVGLLPAAARTIPAPLPSPFHEVREGLVSAKFHPRKDENRVFYAASLKEARAWLPFTGIHLGSSFFSHEGLLAIFYRHSPGGRPEITAAWGLTKPTTLRVEVTLFRTCESLGGSPPSPSDAVVVGLPSCVPSLWDIGFDTVTCGSGGDCDRPWGLFVLEAIDKTIPGSSGPNRFSRLYVDESWYVPPPPVCTPAGCGVVPVVPVAVPVLK